MTNSNPPTPQAVVVRVKLCFQLAPKDDESRDSTTQTVCIPLQIILPLPRQRPLSAQARTVRAALSHNLPSAWLN